MISASRISVGTVPTLIFENVKEASPDEDYALIRALAKNATATETVYLGGVDVATTTGFAWEVADGPLELEIEPGEKLYGIVATVAQSIHVLREGR